MPGQKTGTLVQVRVPLLLVTNAPKKTNWNYKITYPPHIATNEWWALYHIVTIITPTNIISTTNFLHYCYGPPSTNGDIWATNSPLQSQFWIIKDLGTNKPAGR
jgi:hypothetical protein